MENKNKDRPLSQRILSTSLATTFAFFLLGGCAGCVAFSLQATFGPYNGDPMRSVVCNGNEVCSDILLKWFCWAYVVAFFALVLFFVFTLIKTVLKR